MVIVASDIRFFLVSPFMVRLLCLGGGGGLSKLKQVSARFEAMRDKIRHQLMEMLPRSSSKGGSDFWGVDFFVWICNNYGIVTGNDTVILSFFE